MEEKHTDWKIWPSKAHPPALPPFFSVDTSVVDGFVECLVTTTTQQVCSPLVKCPIVDGDCEIPEIKPHTNILWHSDNFIIKNNNYSLLSSYNKTPGWYQQYFVCHQHACSCVNPDPALLLVTAYTVLFFSWGLTWILHKAVESGSKMVVEFSRRPLLSVLFPPWLSIFNLSSCYNWLEGQQAGTLLVGCLVPHRPPSAGCLVLSESLYNFCCNAEISSPICSLFWFLLWSR